MNGYILAAWMCFDGSDDAKDERFITRLGARVSMLSDLGPLAVYRLESGGETMAKLARRVARLELDPSLGKSQYVLVLQLGSIGAALGAGGARDILRTKILSGAGVTNSYHALFIESSHTLGPEKLEDSSFGAAIQFGTFSMKDEDGDWAAAEWYDSLRLPSIERMPGAHRARRLFSVCGIPKFGIFYEFASLQMRERHFETAHEKHALDRDHPTGRVVERTVHTPMSPSVGERIVPALETV